MTEPKLCECGCGKPAPIAKQNDPRRGYIKGQPVRFRKGHIFRGANHYGWRGDDAGYGAIHRYLRAHFPKTGVCDECGEAKRTEYALIKGRSYSRNREDYRELCKRCHNLYDNIGGSRWRGVETAVTRAGDAPECKCGCGTRTQWSTSKAAWRSYAQGHHRPPRPALAPLVVACSHCGAEFTRKRRSAVFCSKACKAAHRRAAGLDDIERTCHQCGTAFTINRYSKQRHCSRSCGTKCQHSGDCPG